MSNNANPPSGNKQRILLETATCESVYDPNTVFSEFSPTSRTEIGLVLSGSGTHRILNQEIPCREGDIFIVDANIPHGYFVNEEGESLSVRRLLFHPQDWFSGAAGTVGSEEFCHGIFREGSAVSCARLNAYTHEEVMARMDAIVTETEEAKEEWQAAVSAHLSLLLITVGRYIHDAIKTIPTAPTKEWRIVSSAIRMVLQNYADCHLTLDTVAAELFVSTSTLSRLFKRLNGVHFSEYVRSVRLSNACRLLKDTELTVEEIVATVGLRDIPTFYHIFSVHTGMTPNQYRTKYKNKISQKSKGKKAMMILSEISAQLQAGKAKLVKELVQQAINEGVPADTILKEGLVAGMSIIGEKFKNNEVFVPEVLVAARAMNQGAALLKPLLVQEGVEPVGKICIGTVLGDLHDIGKNIVKMMLEGKGFEVIDLGTDVPAETFVNTAIEQGCQIICCSALLTTTMGVMGDVVKAAVEKGVRDQVKIMVGGAPINEDFAREIGADAYTQDAATCAEVALSFVK